MVDFAVPVDHQVKKKKKVNQIFESSQKAEKTVTYESDDDTSIRW